MTIRYNDDYRHNTPWWQVDLADLVRRGEDGRTESEQDCCDRLMSQAGEFGMDPLSVLIAHEEHIGDEA